MEAETTHDNLIVEEYRRIANAIIYNGLVPPEIDENASTLSSEQLVYLGLQKFRQNVNVIAQDLNLNTSIGLEEFHQIEETALCLIIHEGVFDMGLLSSKLFVLEILAISTKLKDTTSVKERYKILTFANSACNNVYAPHGSYKLDDRYIFSTPFGDMVIYPGTMDLIGLSARILRMPHTSRFRAEYDLLSPQGLIFKFIERITEVLEKFQITLNG